MGEVKHLFGKIGERNDMIKVLNRYNYKRGARFIADLSDLEYKRIVPVLNETVHGRVREWAEQNDVITEAIAELGDEYDPLDICMAVLKLSDQYAETLRNGCIGMNKEDSNTVVAGKLLEAMKLEAVAQKLEELYGNNHKTGR